MTEPENYLPTKQLQDLPINYYYQVCDHSRMVQTKDGVAVLAYLFDPNTEEKFKVVLPKRFNSMTDLLDDYEVLLAFAGTKKTKNNFDKHLVHLKSPKNEFEFYQKTV